MKASNHTANRSGLQLSPADEALDLNDTSSDPVAVRIAPTGASVRHGICRRGLVGLLVFLLLFCSALAVSSAHRQSHDFGRATPSHECAFCLFMHGQITLSDVSHPSVRGSAVMIGIVAPIHAAIPASMDYRLSPSRAPPV